MENWKTIEGHKDYMISDHGRVKSLKNNGETILKPRKLPTGYARVYLNLKDIYIHRLVCIHFHDNPENKSQVNHKNGIKWDNRATNVEWSTPQENSQHAYDSGLNQGNGWKKLTDKDAFCIRMIYKQGNLGMTKIARRYNVLRSCIERIIKNKTYKTQPIWT